MSQKEYRFDPSTLKYDEDNLSAKQKIIRFILTQVLTGIVIAFVLFLSFSYLFETKEEKSLMLENEKLEEEYKILSERFEQTQQVLKDVKKRDDNLYRAIFETDPVGTDSLVSRNFDLEHLQVKSLIAENEKRLRKLSHQTVLQASIVGSIDSLIKLQANVLDFLPSIQPLKNDDLELIFFGYGQRIDPFYKTPAFHRGIDFAAPEGTPVYATADGTVEQANQKRLNGKQIIINHGHGYKTTYAHLSNILVKRGRKVKRGDVIGLVGNTGKSRTEHLHYEVALKNKPVNPINFFFVDLTPEQYYYMIQESSRGGLSLD